MAELKSTTIAERLSVSGPIIENNKKLEDKYAPINHTHEVTTLPSDIDDISIKGSVKVESDTTDSKAKGIEFLDSDGNIVGGVGSTSENGTFNAISIAMAEDYYNTINGLSITSSDIKWKGEELATINSNIASASKLANPRTISLSGDVLGSGAFDGSNNLDIPVSLNTSKLYTTDNIESYTSTSLYNAVVRTVSRGFYSAKLNIRSVDASNNATNIIVSIFGLDNFDPSISIRSLYLSDYIEAVRVIYPKDVNSDLTRYIEFKFPNNTARSISVYLVEGVNVELFGPELTVYDETVYTYSERIIPKKSGVYTHNSIYDKSEFANSANYLNFDGSFYTVGAELKTNDIAIADENNILYPIQTSGIRIPLGSPIVKVNSDHSLGTNIIDCSYNGYFAANSIANTTGTVSLYLQGTINNNTFISEGALVSSMVSGKYYIFVGFAKEGYIGLNIGIHKCYYLNSNGVKEEYIGNAALLKTGGTITGDLVVKGSITGIMNFNSNELYSDTETNTDNGVNSIILSESYSNYKALMFSIWVDSIIEETGEKITIVHAATIWKWQIDAAYSVTPENQFAVTFPVIGSIYLQFDNTTNTFTVSEGVIKKIICIN